MNRYLISKRFVCSVLWSILFLVFITIKSQDASSQEWEEVVESDDFVSDAAVSREKKASESEWEDVFVNTWEALDSYLVNTIASLPKDALSEDERDVLLETLLDSRYRFASEISNKDTALDKNFVEDEFVDAWENISPIMKKHVSGRPPEESKRQLAFISASDALAKKETAKPDSESRVNKKALTRLAKTMKSDDSFELEYTHDVNRNLRDVLGMDSAGDEWEIGSDVGSGGRPAGAVDKAEATSGELPDSQKILASKKPPVSVKSRTSGGTVDHRQWIVTRDNFDSYFKRVKTLLAESSDMALKKRDLDKRYHELYRTFVLAAAWQESLYRQFIEKKGKVDYLRSYDDSSVGLMQINERIWRGLYNQERIRWDIKYNAMVGCEIINLYLNKYALKKMAKMNLKKPLDDVTLSRAMYAMYNGGPGQFHKFLKRHETGNYWKIDKYFYQKYKWVRAGEWRNLRSNLFGK